METIDISDDSRSENDDLYQPKSRVYIQKHQTDDREWNISQSVADQNALNPNKRKVLENSDNPDQVKHSRGSQFDSGSDSQHSYTWSQCGAVTENPVTCICMYCVPPQGFMHHTDLTLHLQEHVQEDSTTCKHCNVPFKGGHFIAHIEQKHVLIHRSKNTRTKTQHQYGKVLDDLDDKQGANSCDTSGPSAGRPYKSGVTTGIHACLYCVPAMEFVSKDQLMNHLSKVHASKGTYCAHCEIYLSSKHHKLKHLAEFHAKIDGKFSSVYKENNEKYACLYCASSPDFASKAQLMTHLSREHVDKGRFCGRCNIDLPSSEAKLNHLVHFHAKIDGILPASLPPFACLYCLPSKGYKSKVSLMEHLSTKHATGAPFCNICNMSLTSSVHMVKHLLNFHARVNSIYPINVSEVDLYQTQPTRKFNQTSLFCCLYCKPSQDFPSKDLLVLHISTQHANIYKTAKRKNRHWKGPFCEICKIYLLRGYSTSAETMTKHLLDFHCKINGIYTQTYSQGNIEKANACLYCAPPRHFGSKRFLYTHLSKEHSTKGTYCARCNIKLLSSGLKLKHLKEFHATIDGIGPQDPLFYEQEENIDGSVNVDNQAEVTESFPEDAQTTNLLQISGNIEIKCESSSVTGDNSESDEIALKFEPPADLTSANFNMAGFKQEDLNDIQNSETSNQDVLPAQTEEVKPYCTLYECVYCRPPSTLAEKDIGHHVTQHTQESSLCKKCLKHFTCKETMKEHIMERHVNVVKVGLADMTENEDFQLRVDIPGNKGLIEIVPHGMLEVEESMTPTGSHQDIHRVNECATWTPKEGVEIVEQFVKNESVLDRDNMTIQAPFVNINKETCDNEKLKKERDSVNNYILNRVDSSASSRNRLECVFCGAVFYYEESLIRHLDTHSMDCLPRVSSP